MKKKTHGRETEILTDAGPLTALVDKTDPNHDRVAASQRLLPKVPLLTTWPCLTEAVYLIGEATGHLGQEILWSYVADALLLLHDLTHDEQSLMRTMMSKYADIPMDLADASLIAAAEMRQLTRVFSIDSDFYIYRLPSGRALEVLPGPRRH